MTDRARTDLAAADPAIELVEVTKTHRGAAAPAVDRLSLSVRTGEILVVVGPSGAGKTTALRMINRLVEPTSGRVLVGGQDVTTIDVDRLRHGVGFLTEDVGLFPHQTIAANVATVPSLLGWDAARTAARVDELLERMGLDPAVFGERYPKELSGGQRQRVGLARALAADPPILLLDEPFAATDPITRTRLENELLRLQADQPRTVVLVTHDIDEAIKMADRVAVLGPGGRLAQLGTPEEVLTAPADEFVEDFVGAGATLKRLNLTRVRDVPLITDCLTGTVDEDRDTLRRRLHDSDWTALLLLDHDRRPRRWLRAPDFRSSRPVEALGLPAVALVERQATLADALDEMLVGSAGVAIVVDGRGAFEGLVDIDTITATMRELHEANVAYYRAAKLVDPEAATP